LRFCGVVVVRSVKIDGRILTRGRLFAALTAAFHTNGN